MYTYTCTCTMYMYMYSFNYNYFILQAMNDISGIDGQVSNTTVPLSRPSSVKRKSISSGRVSVISTTPTTRDHSLLLLDNFSSILESLDHYQVSNVHYPTCTVHVYVNVFH